MKCRICEKKEANQTGAHIFPSWMLASAFDKKARNRHYETIFALTPLFNDLPYFGRSVLPEKDIHNLIGRDLTDEERTRQKNMFVLDNYWCRECEGKIKIVEDYFLENIERKSLNFNSNEQITLKEFENVNIYIVRLFLYTLIFRAHLASLFGFQLNKKSYSKIKKFITQYLKSNLNDTLNNIIASENKNQLLKYPIRCIKAEHKEGETDNFVFTEKRHYKPYCLIINRYIIQFYGKGNQAKFSNKTCFGLCTLIGNSVDIRNYKEDIFKLGLINLELWRKIKKNLINYYVDYWMNNFILMYKHLYKKKFHVDPEREQIGRFLNELLNNDIELGIKFTKNKVLEAINRSIKK